MSKIGEIFKGFGNLALDQFDLLDEETKKMGEQRLLICEPCEFRDGERCGVCKCILAAKSLSPKSVCPKGFWELKGEKGI